MEDKDKFSARKFLSRLQKFKAESTLEEFSPAWIRQLRKFFRLVANKAFKIFLKNL